jgi:acetoin utilization deacetylase AcuC-like enzyme
VTEEQRPSANSNTAPNMEGESAARLPTAFVTHALMLEHEAPDDFPERPERLATAVELIEALIAEGTLPAEKLLRLPTRAATDDEVATVHDPAYVARVHRAVADLSLLLDEADTFLRTPIRRFATDVYLSPGSDTAATHAAGAAMVALDAIAAGRARNGYALVRPPGHHASRAAAMGFCIFNNVAIAARYAQQRHGWEKVLIVDFDVHHGNGTQDIFYDDPTVTYFSTHQYPWYPGSGAANETGVGEGKGSTINVPLPAGSGWSVYDPIFRQVLWPVADRFKPDVVLVSAGFDAHFTEDPGLGEMRLSTPDFSDLMLELTEIADRYCGGRIVAIQEGGYHLTALSQCAATLLVALTGSDGIVDTLGQPEPLDFRWNEEAIIQALYQVHDLAGYRRKARRPINPEQVRPAPRPAPVEPTADEP